MDGSFKQAKESSINPIYFIFYLLFRPNCVFTEGSTNVPST